MPASPATIHFRLAQLPVNRQEMYCIDSRNQTYTLTCTYTSLDRIGCRRLPSPADPRSRAMSTGIHLCRRVSVFSDVCSRIYTTLVRIHGYNPMNCTAEGRFRSSKSGPSRKCDRKQGYLVVNVIDDRSVVFCDRMLFLIAILRG